MKRKRDLGRYIHCLCMNENQIRSVLSQLGMFLKKKAEEDVSTNPQTSEWMSAWETKSSDGINIVLAILLTEKEKDAALLRSKMNEFAAAAKIEFRDLYEMEK
jgi:hypothetical protein